MTSATATVLLQRVRGDVLVLSSAILFGLSSALVKIVVASIHPLQAAWVRFIIPTVILLLGAKAGWFSLRVQRVGILGARGLFAAMGVMCAFYAVSLTTFSNFAVLVQTNPIFGTLISTWYFGEPFRRRHALVLLLSFGGIYLVMLPAWQGPQLGDLLALLSGLFFGVGIALMREATKTETIGSITLSFYLFASVLSAPVAWQYAQPFTATVLALLAGVMIIGTTAQVVEIAGYRRCSVAVGGSLSYFGVVVQIVMAVVFFHEALSGSFLLGAAVIIACGVWLLMERQPASYPPMEKAA